MNVEERTYWRCETCALTWLDAVHHLGPEAERAVYDQHDNRVDDQGYRGFLARLVTPLLTRLDKPCEGLDLGCGPGPALAAMMTEAGHEMSLYDPYYAPDPAVLETTYDVITTTETVEHFYAPGEAFARIAKMLRPGGWLGVMTCFQTDDARFARWHYRRDPTHVAFYREETMHWIARRHGWDVWIPAKDVVIFHRPSVP